MLLEIISMIIGAVTTEVLVRTHCANHENE